MARAQECRKLDALETAGFWHLGHQREGRAVPSGIFELNVDALEALSDGAFLLISEENNNNKTDLDLLADNMPAGYPNVCEDQLSK